MDYLSYKWMRKWFCVIIGLYITFGVNDVSAQDVKNIRGEYSHVMADNESKDEAKKFAEEQARLVALANEFGTQIIQNNFTNIENVSGTSKINFKSHSESNVKGVWLGDIELPRFEEFYDPETQKMVIIAHVYGKACEIETVDYDLEIRTLCNGVEDRNESTIFNSGDQMFLSFRSPVNGYLAVYLVDEDDCVSCMLPYESVEDGKIAIKAKNEYVFFSKNHVESPLQRFQVTPLKLLTKKEEEINWLYVMFSTMPFVKANDNKTESDDGSILLRSLSLEHFRKWFIKNRTRDKNMQVSVIPLRIIGRS